MKKPESDWTPLLRPAAFLKGAAFLACFAGVWFAFNYSTLREYFEARRSRNGNKHDVQELERNFSALVKEKRQLEKWGFSAEKEIRERFKMIRPGEKIILIEPDVEGS